MLNAEMSEALGRVDLEWSWSCSAVHGRQFDVWYFSEFYADLFLRCLDLVNATASRCP